MTKKEYAKKLMKYIDESPTQYQSTNVLTNMLKNAGAVELKEGDSWDLKSNQLYYMTKGGTQIASFKLNGDPRETGFRICAAHHDSPCFRIKSVPSAIDFSYERLSLEGYGGAIIHTWLDRPLSIAGRVFVKDSNDEGCKPIDIYLKKTKVIIPSAAIHMVNNVNAGATFNVQTEMCPFFAQNEDRKPKFLSYLAKQIKVKEDDILSFDLALFDSEPACFIGLDDEFISAPRLDDTALAFSVISGICESTSSSACDIGMVYDHEEIGSRSDRGAYSNTLMQIIDRICEKLGYSQEDKYRALSKTVILSADMAHAGHPSYLGKSEPHTPVFLNKGPVLKLASRQSYSTSPKGSAIFKVLCEKNDIPYQVFNNRADVGGGGTIGPILSANYGVVSIDIGNPMLSMHSVRELGGTDDTYYMVKLMKAFYENN